MDASTLNIKHYGDYRDYLSAYFTLKKASNPSFSYGQWSKRLGLKGTSSLTKVIQGEREPGPVITEKIGKYFDFDATEMSYFSDLIRLSKLKDDPRLRMMVMEKMGREFPDAKLKVIDDKSSQIISDWFCLTIREMVRLQDFQEDLSWIQKRLLFPVEVPDIELAIKNLLHQGFIKRDRSGTLVTSAGLLHTTNDVSSKAIKQYHSQMLDNAKLALKDVDVSLREFSAETLTISTQKIPVAKELIRDFKAKFARLLEEQSGDETYQLQIQFFPLTKEQNR